MNYSVFPSSSPPSIVKDTENVLAMGDRIEEFMAKMFAEENYFLA